MMPIASARSLRLQQTRAAAAIFSANPARGAEAAVMSVMVVPI